MAIVKVKGTGVTFYSFRSQKKGRMEIFHAALTVSEASETNG